MKTNFRVTTTKRGKAPERIQVRALGRCRPKEFRERVSQD